MLNLPNTITLARIALVPVFTYLFLQSPAPPSWSAAIIFLLAALTDGLDGYLARSRQEITRFGQLIDPIADKLLITAALLVLLQSGLTNTWVVLIILAREFSVSALRILAAAEGMVIAASHWGKAKTIIQIIAVMAFLLGITWASTLMYLAVIITIVSGVDYFYKAQNVLKSSMK